MNKIFALKLMGLSHSIGPLKAKLLAPVAQYMFRLGIRLLLMRVGVYPTGR